MGRKNKKNANPCSVRYDRKFKEQVCDEFLKGGICKTDLEKKYQIGHGRVLYWLQECGYLAKEGKLTPKRNLMANKKSKSGQSDNLSSSARIKELEKALEQSNLQAEAYRIMIEVAEKELNIAIKKK